MLREVHQYLPQDKADFSLMNQYITEWNLLSQDKKELISSSILRNDLRLYPEDQLKFDESLCYSETMGNDISWVEIYNLIKGVTTSNNCLIKQAHQMNEILIKAQKMPIVSYAFGSWLDINQLCLNFERFMTKIFERVQLTGLYFYRLIPLEFNQPSIITGADKIGQGAYSEVYLKENQVIKIVKNLAGKFSLASEIECYRLMKSFPELWSRIPRIVNSKKGSYISHEFIQGKTGDQYLLKGKFMGAENQVNDLETIFTDILSFERQTFTWLDIHPNNFVWDVKEDKWKIVDLGTTPEIGHDYFPRDNFENYFRKIWLNRKILMEQVPIRSILI